MRHGIGCNIVDVANQLSFTYRGIAPELRVFVSPPTESTRAADFIRALEEKQEVWHKIMTVPTVSNRYHNSFRRPSPFSSSPSRPSLPSQSEAFFRYQAQNLKQPAQQPWRPSDRLVNNSSDGLRRQPPLPFKQNFMPQRQQYPSNNQRLQQTPSTSSPTGTSRDTAPRRTQPNQSTWLNPTDVTT